MQIAAFTLSRVRNWTLSPDSDTHTQTHTSAHEALRFEGPCVCVYVCERTYPEAGGQLVEAGNGRRISAGAAVKALTSLEVPI